MIDVSTYTDFFVDSCLERYVLQGGATVKFCVGDDKDLEALEQSIIASAQQLKMMVVPIDSSRIKVQMIDQLFFAVAGVVDWSRLARAMVNRVCAAAGYPVPGDNEHASLAELAEYYHCEPRELQRDINREFQNVIYRDYSMVHEFRIAMLRLCQYEFRTGQVTDAEAEAINQWLVGELRQISLLRTARIFRKINRSNARQMLFSLVRWITQIGNSGLLLVLDLRQFFKSREFEVGDLPIMYTRAAIIDAYELLRQLIDNTDEFKNLATAVCVPAEFVTDRTRGVDAYQALKLRIYDEVRDQTRDNPYASLIRLGPGNDGSALGADKGEMGTYAG